MLQRVITPPGTADTDAGLQRIQAAMRPHYPRFSDQEYDRRHRAIRAEMARQDLSCLIIYAGGYAVGNQKNLHYVSNLITYLPSFLVFPIDGEPTLYMLIYSFIPGGRSISNVDDVRWSLGADGPIDRIKELGLDKGQDRARWGGWHHELHTPPTRRATHIRIRRRALRELHIRHASAHENTERRGVGMVSKRCGLLRFGHCGVYRKPPNRGKPITKYMRPSTTPTCHNRTACSILPGSDRHPWTIPPARIPSVYRPDAPSNAATSSWTEVSGAYHGYAGQIARPVALGKPPQRYVDFFSCAEEVYHGVQETLIPGNTPRDVLDVSQKILDAGYSVQMSHDSRLGAAHHSAVRRRTGLGRMDGGTRCAVRGQPTHHDRAQSLLTRYDCGYFRRRLEPGDAPRWRAAACPSVWIYGERLARSRSNGPHHSLASDPPAANISARSSEGGWVER